MSVSTHRHNGCVDIDNCTLDSLPHSLFGDEIIRPKMDKENASLSLSVVNQVIFNKMIRI